MHDDEIPLLERPAADAVEPLEVVTRLAVEVDRAYSALGVAAAARDVAIRHAIAAGVSVAAIVDATRLSRPRVYQIRDGVR